MLPRASNREARESDAGRLTGRGGVFGGPNLVPEGRHRNETPGNELPRHPDEAFCGEGIEPVVDPRATALGDDDPSLSQDFEVVRNGGLPDAATTGQVAGADLRLAGQLPDDRQSGGIAESLEQLDFRVDRFHAGRISSVVY